jgi:Cof subfamily protein (haloacid dehalogenase superfamily)
MKILPSANDLPSELIPFSKIRYIVTDLDGTLVHDFKTIFDRIRRNIFYLRTKKISFTIATGRSLFGARPILHSIELPKGTPIILYNGTVIVKYHTPEVVLSENITKDTTNSVFTITQKYQVSAYASFFNKDSYQLNNGIITQDCETVNGWGKIISEHDYNGTLVVWNDIVDSMSPTTIVMKCDDIQKKLEVLEELRKLTDINITTSGSGYIEISPKLCDKGNALNLIRHQYNWPAESVLCIGDNDNDVPLLLNSDIGVVVKNASINAKENAMYISNNNSTAGVLEVIDVIKDAIRYCDT